MPEPIDMPTIHAMPDDAPPGTKWTPNGRLVATNARETDRTSAVCLHLSPLLAIPIGPIFVLVPLIMWLTMRDRSPFIADHGREQINFMISFVLLHLILFITIVGMLLIPVLWIVGIIGVIRGALAAGYGEYYRYPATIRLIS